MTGSKLTLKGDLCFANVVAQTQRIEAFIDENRDKAVVNLSEIKSTDSSALACLLAALRCAKSHGCVLSIVSCPDSLLQLAKVCGVDSILPFQ